MTYRPQVVRESNRYRGRRRMLGPSRGRFTVTLLTACLGAGLVALGSGEIFADTKMDDSGLASTTLDRDIFGSTVSRGDRALSSSTSDGPQDAWVLPVHNYNVTSSFGPRNGRMHTGVDLGGIKLGADVLAVHAGTVTMARRDGSYGIAVRIDHGGGIISVYGHNSKVRVTEGQQVNAGDIIAEAGNTGYSFGVHVHLEIRVNGEPIEPVAFLKSKCVDLRMEIAGAYDAGAC